MKIKVDISDDPTDNVIRQRVKKCMNGDYAKSICRNCGYYNTDPEVTTDYIPIITPYCNSCALGILNQAINHLKRYDGYDSSITAFLKSLGDK